MKKQVNSLLKVSRPVSRWSYYFNPAKVSCVCVGRVHLFMTPWTMALHAPLSMGFSRQEYWSGLPFTSPGIFPTQVCPIADRFFTLWVTRESQSFNCWNILPFDSFSILYLYLPEICTYLHVCIHISMYVLIY